MSEDLIDSDIRVAKTLPSKFYTSEKRFRKLLRAFKTSWQFVGSSQEFTTAISPLKDLEKVLNEPLIRVQDGESTQLLSNVCTHRGMILCQENSDAKNNSMPIPRSNIQSRWKPEAHAWI
jgi:choline monooxygenase